MKVFPLSLTKPELSIQISKSIQVILPASEEIDRAVLSPLEDLNANRCRKKNQHDRFQGWWYAATKM